MRHDFVTIADLSKEKIMYLLEMAKEFEKHPNRELLKGKVVACLAVSCKMRRHKGMTFFCENVKISETVLEYQDI